MVTDFEFKVTLESVTTLHFPFRPICNDNKTLRRRHYVNWTRQFHVHDLETTSFPSDK